MAGIIKVSSSINAPVEQIWNDLMNPGNLKQWLTGFISAEQVSGKAGEAGSVSKLRFTERGREIEVLETVLSCRMNQQYSSRMEHHSFTVENDLRLVSFGKHSEIIQTVRFQPKNFFMKLLLPFMTREMKKRNLNELLRLKKFVESKHQ